jgi:manganese transport protein
MSVTNPSLTPGSLGIPPPGDPAAVHGESLHEVRGTIAIPDENGTFWQNWRAFVGPALLVSVGYMDPGNWSTDLTAGAEYKYALLWVVALSSLMAIILQICAAKLGVVTGKDLARASRDYFPRWTRIPNWLTTEVAIAACDLAEVLGSAVALHLLFPHTISILTGVFITAFDVMILMALQGLGFRKIETFILVLVATIAGCYFVELFVLGAVYNDAAAIGAALVSPSLPPKPSPDATASLAIAIGVIGATVMPHNLYLHSALVQTRKLQRDSKTVRRAIKFNSIDSVVALSLAFLVNASILILAAMTFYGKADTLTLPDGRPIGDDWIQGAYHTLGLLKNTTLASILFAVALLASGQSSTITGTLAGQIVMEGFMSWNVRPWVRRLITRLIAIIPAVIVISIYGDRKVNDLLNVSQIVLGLQLPLAMIPLMYFTSRRKIMGEFVNGTFVKIAGWSAVILITSLDMYLLYSMFTGD